MRKDCRVLMALDFFFLCCYYVSVVKNTKGVKSSFSFFQRTGCGGYREVYLWKYVLLYWKKPVLQGWLSINQDNLTPLMALEVL